MSTLVRRIAAGMGALAFGQAVTIGMQLAALPLFLSYWDAAHYGVWLMLSAVPSYFSMADVGMVTTAGNKMTMAIGRGDSHTANCIFQSALVFMLVVCVVLLVPTISLLAWAPLPGLDTVELRMTLAALVLVVFFSFFHGLAEAIFRATGRYGLGIVLGNMIRIAEWSGGMMGLWLDGSYLSVALGMLAARVTGVIAIVLFSSWTTQGIVWGFGQARLSEVRGMVKPAFYFLMFPLVNALSLQGFTLLVGGIYGAASVAIFNTYRTLARVTVQSTSILSFAVGPEMSSMYGASNFAALERLFRRSQRFSVALVLGLSILIGLLAPTLLHWWTHGRIIYHEALFWAMMAYATVCGLWHVPRILLMAINRHDKIALGSLCITAATLLAAWLIGQSASLTITTWSLTVSELLMAMMAYQLAWNAIHQRQHMPMANLYTQKP
ncbi:MAG: lipopolysaccharide biosynthesis protein [Burkholderiaceae bacterium]